MGVGEGLWLTLGPWLALVAVVVLVWFAFLAFFVVVRAYQAQRSGWWLYLICMLVPLVNIVAVVAWYTHFRSHPTRLGTSRVVV